MAELQGVTSGKFSLGRMSEAPRRTRRRRRAPRRSPSLSRRCPWRSLLSALVQLWRAPGSARGRGHRHGGTPGAPDLPPDPRLL